MNQKLKGKNTRPQVENSSDQDSLSSDAKQSQDSSESSEKISPEFSRAPQPND